MEPDFEWLMIDATHCKVHLHAAEARGGNQGMWAVIPPRKNRNVLRDYDRHHVENALLHNNQSRRIATCHEKRLSSLLTPAQIRCLVLR